MKYHASPRLEARVSGLLLGTDKGSLLKEPVDRVSLDFEGLQGDRHAGFTRRSGGREQDQYPRGTLIRNNRQWTAISQYELDHIAQRLDLPELQPAWLGANIVLEGVDRLSKLPPFTRLRFHAGTPEQVVLMVYEENLACSSPGKLIAKLLEQPALKSAFVKAAYGYRGTLGWVEQPGEIRVGDTVEIHFPDFLPVPPLFRQETTEAAGPPGEA